MEKQVQCPYCQTSLTKLDKRKNNLSLLVCMSGALIISVILTIYSTNKWYGLVLAAICLNRMIIAGYKYFRQKADKSHCLKCNFDW